MPPARAGVPPETVVRIERISARGEAARWTVTGAGVELVAHPRKGLLALDRLDRESLERVIVEFSAPPASVARRVGADPATARRQHRSFAADLARLEREAGAGDPGAMAVTRSFDLVFNGVALTAPRAIVARIRRLPYVANVFPDDTVRACLGESVPLIRADQVWLSGFTGSGVVVGIIDSGVDYTHPDLGGGFGSGFRVARGYDFVNFDGDPLDDNGHGTHVAGIVGADGSGLRGVAPGVTFHAYKVLDAGGFGTESAVIQAIDQAVDPDRNPATDDGVDVINLSLAGGGDADSPMSQAVDNVVAAGVVCAVAAGNLGGYFTVGSPGAARRAITVGASTKSDVIASFSSRGPSSPGQDIKPDVLAPGVDIFSTWPGGTFEVLSGTSMAAPHVAGAAALLRQMHPGWSPETIKAALMNSAVHIGQDAFTQGAGRIDVLAASAPRFVVAPGSLSFGLAVVAQPVWATSETLQVTNVTAAPIQVALSVQAILPAGASVGVSPGSVTLGPGQVSPVVATLTVDRSATPDLPTEPYAYSGAVVAVSGGVTHRIPLAFLKVPQLVVTLDPGTWSLTVHDRGPVLVQRPFPRPRTTFLLPAGAYDVIAVDLQTYVLPYEATRVVREGIAVADSSTVDIGQADAIYSMSVETIGEHGLPVDCPFGSDFLVHEPSGLYVGAAGSRYSVLRFSPVSPAYAWAWDRWDNTDPARVYSFNGYLRGIDGPVTIQNDPGALRHLLYEYRVDPGVDSILVYHYQSNGPMGVPTEAGRFAYSLATSFINAPPLGWPFIQDAWIMPRQQPEIPGTLTNTYKEAFIHSRPFVLDYGRLLAQTPYLSIAPDQPARGYVLFDDTTPAFTLATQDMKVGHAPPVWFGRFTNETDLMRIDGAFGAQTRLFLSQQGDMRPHLGLPYTLERGGVPVDAGTFWEAGGSHQANPILRTIAPGTWTLDVSYALYHVAGQPGLARVRATFDTEAPDKDPPYLESLNVVGDSVISDVVPTLAADRRVQFRMRDAVALRSVALSYRGQPAHPWTALSLTREADTFIAQLPSGLAGPLSLRIFGDDAAGNSLTYTMEPALGQSIVTAVDPPRAAGAPTPALALAGATPNPGVGGISVRFVLPNGDPATLEVLDIAGRVVVTRDVGALGPGRHTLDLTGERTLRPGVYFIRLKHAARALTAKACVLQ